MPWRLTSHSSVLFARFETESPGSADTNEHVIEDAVMTRQGIVPLPTVFTETGPPETAPNTARRPAFASFLIKMTSLVRESRAGLPVLLLFPSVMQV